MSTDRSDLGPSSTRFLARSLSLGAAPGCLAPGTGLTFVELRILALGDIVAAVAPVVAVALSQPQHQLLI
jgi:hypothetical protein